MQVPQLANTGRFKVTGAQAAVGPAGLMAMAAWFGWHLAEVVYMEDGQAVVEAETAPPSNKVAVQQQGGKGILRIQAVSAKAKELAKAAAQQARQPTNLQADAASSSSFNVQPQALAVLCQAVQASEATRAAAKQSAALATARAELSEARAEASQLKAEAARAEAVAQRRQEVPEAEEQTSSRQQMARQESEAARQAEAREREAEEKRAIEQ